MSYSKASLKSKLYWLSWVHCRHKCCIWNISIRTPIQSVWSIRVGQYFFSTDNPYIWQFFQYSQPLRQPLFLYFFKVMYLQKKTLVQSYLYPPRPNHWRKIIAANTFLEAKEFHIFALQDQKNSAAAQSHFVRQPLFFRISVLTTLIFCRNFSTDPYWPDPYWPDWL